MKILIKLTIFILLFYSCGQDGIGTFNIDDPNVHVGDGYAYIQESYDDDKIPISGKVVGYNENGNLNTELIFENGKMHGNQKWMYDNGQLSKEENWLDGKKNGSFKFYNDKGDLTALINYKNDKNHGVLESWYENGTRKDRINYKNGELHGQKEYWNEKGHISWRLQYLNGKKNGAHSYWDNSGKLRAIFNYRNNIKHGRVQYWSHHDDGYMDREYRNGYVIKEECWVWVGSEYERPCDCDRIVYLNFYNEDL